MQRLDADILKRATAIRMKKLEGEFADVIMAAENKERILCPVCKYESKKNKTSAVVFHNKDMSSLKCFSCGIWRRV